MSDDRKPLPHQRRDNLERKISALPRFRRRRRRHWPMAGRHGTARNVHVRGMFSDLQAPSLQLGLADIPLAGQMQTEMREMRKIGRSNALSTPIGSAIRSQFMRGIVSNGIEPITDDDRKLEVWRDWAADPLQCDYYGKHTLSQIFENAISAWVADGEAFLRFRLGGGGIGLRIELIDSGRVPTFKYEGTKDRLPRNTEVESGIVLDSDRRIYGYILSDRSHIQPSVTQMNYQTGKGLYVPIEEMCHVFEMQQPDQLRGISRLIPCSANISHLTEFSELALKSARLGARHYAAIADPDYDIPDLDDLDELDEDGAAEDFIGNIDGELMLVRTGKDAQFHSIPSDYPSSVFPPFVESQLRMIAASVGIPYHRLASDLSGVNYSAGRIAELSMRAEFEAIRDMFIGQWLRRVWRKFLGMGETSGAFSVDFEREQRVSWTPLFHADIEPAKSTQAYEKLISIGVMSKSEVIRKMGMDPEVVFAEIEEERERFGMPEAQGQEPTEEDPEDEDEEEAEDEGEDPEETEEEEQG